jgi:hypothetical protein
MAFPLSARLPLLLVEGLSRRRSAASEIHGQSRLSMHGFVQK